MRGDWLCGSRAGRGPSQPQLFGKVRKEEGMKGKEVVDVRIPLPRRTYAIAAERASKVGCATGTKLRMDMIL